MKMLLPLEGKIRLGVVLSCSPGLLSIRLIGLMVLMGLRRNELICLGEQVLMVLVGKGSSLPLLVFWRKGMQMSADSRDFVATSIVIAGASDALLGLADVGVGFTRLERVRLKFVVSGGEVF